MQRLLAVRIVRWPVKLAYIVAAGIVGIAIGRGLTALHTESVLESLISGVIGLATYLYGARIFRGRDEAVAPARPWWQMTARAKLSRRLGVLWAVGVVFQLVDIPVLIGQRAQPAAFASAVVTLVFNAALASLYIGSGVRLRRLETQSAPAAMTSPAVPQGATTAHVTVPGPTTRVRVILLPYAPPVRSGPALLRASTDTSRTDVFVAGKHIGSLEAPAIAGLIARTGSLVRAELLRTGDRLWAEVPTAEAFAAAARVES